MADGNVILAAAEIVKADLERKYVVVSAPGKRFGADVKVTDLLYRCSDAIENGDNSAFEETFARVRERFLSIEREIGKSFGLDEALQNIKTEMLSGCGRDYCASRGEYLAAKIMAGVLDVPFIDATEFVRFCADGTFDEETTYSLAEEVFKKNPCAVIPGFYGLGADGKVKTFSRGGGDISGAIVAHAVGAALYENWTDVSGFFACDPRIISAPKWIAELSYQELRELSYMGANVLHSDSIFPVRSKGIPVRICNTFRPTDRGTYIVATAKRQLNKDDVVTGIAGKKGFTVISIEKPMMNTEVGFIKQVLEIVAEYGISIEHLPTGIDSMALVIDNCYLSETLLETLLKEIEKRISPDTIFVRKNIAMIATVGHGMVSRVGTAARLFSALADSGINVATTLHAPNEFSIIVGVEEHVYEECIRALYAEFFGSGGGVS